MKKGFLIGLAAVFLIGCATDEQEQQSGEDTDVSEDDMLEATILLTEDGGEVIEEEEVMFTEGNSLMSIMDENFDLVTDADGAFIEGINGYDSNETDGYFWTYTINDEEVFEGAEDVELEDGDDVYFDFSEW
ncbi:additional lipoprotein component of predicted cobalamin ECF transporter [Geomicrobium sp. JCM 19037]|uniref:DUF4430 domain-containing protein n=1 Tax=Geomicrobium sp. JCM 19037 TaxID=1460634 RepID=UPI00045F302F|nr:DUF4430 domain-containing protein [Geomicrobium sp. JCM 19037]GAK02175.1 additional lipoprotein component of predicted cobalamin ECF transporter [Geomicrobium sp. JCM 19037]